MPGEALAFQDNTFTHSITNIGILVFADGAKGAREIYRTLKLGGTAIVTSWEFLGVGPPMRQACLKVRLGEKPVELPIEKVWFQPAHLEKTMREAGFGDGVELKSAEFGIKAESLPLLFEAFRPEMRKTLVGWAEEELEELNREFLKMAEEAAVLVDGTDGEKVLGVKMKTIIAVCRK